MVVGHMDWRGIACKLNKLTNKTFCYCDSAIRGHPGNHILYAFNHLMPVRSGNAGTLYRLSCKSREKRLLKIRCAQKMTTGSRATDSRSSMRTPRRASE